MKQIHTRALAFSLLEDRAQGRARDKAWQIMLKDKEMAEFPHPFRMHLMSDDERFLMPVRRLDLNLEEDRALEKELHRDRVHNKFVRSKMLISIKSN